MNYTMKQPTCKYSSSNVSQCLKYELPILPSELSNNLLMIEKLCIEFKLESANREKIHLNSGHSNCSNSVGVISTIPLNRTTSIKVQSLTYL